MNLPLKILLVEDSPTDCILFKEHLRLSKINHVEITNADTISRAIECLRQPTDIIFLDLFLPDSDGISTFHAIRAAANHTPVIILSNLKDSTVALETIKLGAQDYLIKEDLNDKILYTSVHYSIERKRIEEKLKISNERYELLAKATSDAVWDLDIATNRIDYWNDGMEKLFGYSPDMIDPSPKWWLDNVHEDDQQSIRDNIAAILVQKQDRFSLEFRFRCAGGEYKHVLIRAHILYDTNRPYRLIGSIEDIHALKMAQAELLREQVRHQQQITEKTIEIQERERTELGRELHDNINQLLASSRICLDTAMTNENARDEMMHLSYKNLGIAINEIRKISHELTPPSLGDIGLNEAVQELIGPIVSAHAINIRQKIEILSIEPHIQLMVFRVIQEQLQNIIKYSHATYALITVKQAGDALLVEISDNGVGFDPHEKSNGIGLSNIKSRAQVYGGEAKIISSPGNGCNVWMYIPMKRVKAI